MKKAYIEEIKESIIDSKAYFLTCDLKAILPYRRANLKSTDMLWITKRPVIDCAYNVYNAKALIFVILN